MTARDVEEPLDLGQAARLLDLPPETLATLARAGTVPGWRDRGRWRFSRRVLIARATTRGGGG